MISSLLQKPAKGGIPAIAIVPIRKSVWVQGIFDFNAPILRISCSPDNAWMTDPADKNKSALKNAWVIRWKTAAVYAPRPQPRNMYPSWLTVE